MKTIMKILVAVMIIASVPCTYAAVGSKESKEEIVTTIDANVTAIPTEADVAEELVKLLCEMYGDKEIRQNVHKSLVSIGKPAVKPLMKQLDNKKEVRTAVADVIGDIGPDATEAVPELIKRLDDPESGVRKAIANAIGKIGPRAKAAVEKLRSKIDDRTDVRAAVAEALGKIGPPSAPAVPVLVKKAMGDSSIKVRLASIEALGDIGPKAKAAIPALKVIMESYLKSSDPRQRKLSLYADKSLIQINPADRSPVKRIIADSLAGSGAVQDHATFILMDLGKEVEPELRAALKEKKQGSKEYERIESILKKIEEKSSKKPKKAIKIPKPAYGVYEKSDKKAREKAQHSSQPIPHQVYDPAQHRCKSK